MPRAAVPFQNHGPMDFGGKGGKAMLDIILAVVKIVTLLIALVDLFVRVYSRHNKN